MRILHVLEPADGGVPRYVQDVALGLLQRGHSVGAIVSNRGSIASDMSAIGVDVVAIDLAPEMIAPVADLRAIRRLFSTIRHSAADVVHTHGSKAGALARPLARLLGSPVVHSPHGYAYRTQRLRPRGGIEVRRALTLRIEKVLAHSALVTVFVSKDEQTTAIHDGIVRAARAAVVRHGISDSPLQPPDPVFTRLRDQAPLIGFVGRLAWQKDPLLAVEAFALLRERGVDFKAVIVGDGPLENNVRAAVAAADLETSVVVHPYAPYGRRVLGALDVFVLTSRWEGLPIAVLEAMAAAIPVVAADVGGVREAVVDGRTGYLVPSDDAVAVAAALERLVGDSSLRTRMGEAGRAFQLESFGFDRMIDQLEDVYRRVLGTSPARRRTRSR